MRHASVFTGTLLWIGLLCWGTVSGAEQPSDTVSLPPKAKFHLYLLIGQSNMAGRGKMADADRKPVEGILKLDKQDHWVPAAHPLHFDKPAIAGVGLGLSFAKEMAKTEPGVVIGLIPCAVGGTPLSRWVRGGDLYQEAHRRTKIAMKDGTFCGVLWHQGEGDSGSMKTASTYAQRLDQMVADLRSDLGIPGLPFVAGRLGEFFVAKVDNDAVREVDNALKTVGDRVEFAACASAKGLEQKGDRTHFNTDALREFGRRYAAEMKKLQGQ